MMRWVFLVIQCQTRILKDPKNIHIYCVACGILAAWNYAILGRPWSRNLGSSALEWRYLPLSWQPWSMIWYINIHHAMIQDEIWSSTNYAAFIVPYPSSRIHHRESVAQPKFRTPAAPIVATMPLFTSHIGCPGPSFFDLNLVWRFKTEKNRRSEGVELFK